MAPDFASMHTLTQVTRHAQQMGHRATSASCFWGLGHQGLASGGAEGQLWHT